MRGSIDRYQRPNGTSMSPFGVVSRGKDQPGGTGNPDGAEQSLRDPAFLRLVFTCFATAK
ncbi:hypothetical protein [Lentimonas sp. CC10]|uniref:hypothetical protein n=1 Tax=Lentimonas sp. CC10 TaxID=2676095 RepID=UPI001389DEFB|nr:hypothetical protein [Lentimonas sp. CC10]